MSGVQNPVPCIDIIILQMPPQFFILSVSYAWLNLEMAVSVMAKNTKLDEESKNGHEEPIIEGGTVQYNNIMATKNDKVCINIWHNEFEKSSFLA